MPHSLTDTYLPNYVVSYHWKPYLYIHHHENMTYHKHIHQLYYLTLILKLSTKNRNIYADGCPIVKKLENTLIFTAYQVNVVLK
jgi:hypothetical protein